MNIQLQSLAPPVKKITKRNGLQVDFNPVRIRNAIKSALLSQGYSDEEKCSVLTNEVVHELVAKFPNSLPGVENIQNVVVNILFRYRFDSVARAYKLYREQRQKEREQTILEEINKKRLFMTDDLTKDRFVFNKQAYFERLKSISKGLTHVDTQAILNTVCKGLYDGVLVSELKHLAIKEVEFKMEEHYDYSYFGSRLVLDDLYKNILKKGFDSQEAYQKSYLDAFSDYIKLGLDEQVLHPEMQGFNLSLLIPALKPERDLKLQYISMQTLADRYLLKTRQKYEKSQYVFELPQWMWMRIAMGLAIAEKKTPGNREKYAIEFYETLSAMRLISSTPTLFNSGTKSMQLSSCYINTVEDSIQGIFGNYAEDANLSKWAGGIGTDWTAVRSSGSTIRGTNGFSSGIIPFIKIFNDVAIAVNQGGKRRGAMAAYLENWHLDIEEFLELKKNTGDERRRSHDIHPAVFISDLFMKRVEQNADWTLFSPNDVRKLHNNYGKKFEEHYCYYEKNPPRLFKVVKARSLWRKILTMLYETGHPWITFKDAMNVRSPQDHVGMIHSSNLCTEITLNTSKEETAVCNLASINLKEMIKNGKLDEKLVEKTITTGMRMLDNVIDINFYPSQNAKRANLRHRPVGLGMMGYHDALFKLGIPYSSKNQIAFADYSMELISYFAILSSAKLAKERGAYSSFQGSKWDRGILPIDTLDILEKQRGKKIDVNRNSTQDWSKVRQAIKKYGMRNSNTMAIAPTATIANIAGVSPCVEPIARAIYMKENLSGNFYVINRYLIDRMLKLNLWNRKTITQIKQYDGSINALKGIPQAIKDEFKSVFEIDQTWLIEAAAVRSKWIDQSASTNLFLQTRDGNLLKKLYAMVWNKGIKTTYYLRTIAFSQIEKMLSPQPQEINKIVNPTANATEKNTIQYVPSSPPPRNQLCSLDQPDCEVCQ